MKRDHDHHDADGLDEVLTGFRVEALPRRGASCRHGHALTVTPRRRPSPAT